MLFDGVVTQTGRSAPSRALIRWKSSVAMRSGSMSERVRLADARGAGSAPAGGMEDDRRFARRRLRRLRRGGALVAAVAGAAAAGFGVPAQERGRERRQGPLEQRRRQRLPKG